MLALFLTCSAQHDVFSSGDCSTTCYDLFQVIDTLVLQAPGTLDLLAPAGSFPLVIDQLIDATADKAYAGSSENPSAAQAAAAMMPNPFAVPKVGCDNETSSTEIGYFAAAGSVNISTARLPIRIVTLIIEEGAVVRGLEDAFVTKVTVLSSPSPSPPTAPLPLIPSLPRR